MFNVSSFPSLWNKIITFRHTLSSSLFSQAAEGASHTYTSLELGIRVAMSCFPHCGLGVMHVRYILLVCCFCVLDIFLKHAHRGGMTDMIFFKCMLQNLQLKVINGPVTWLVIVVSFSNCRPPPADLTSGTQTFYTCKSWRWKTCKSSLFGRFHLDLEGFGYSFLDSLSFVLSSAEPPTLDPTEDGFAVSSILHLSIVSLLLVSVDFIIIDYVCLKTTELHFSWVRENQHNTGHDQVCVCLWVHVSVLVASACFLLVYRSTWWWASPLSHSLAFFSC